MKTQSELRFGKEIEKLQIGDIQALIQDKIDESHSLEYKEPTGNLNEDCNGLAETISGFLNTDGGILVYGVSERKERDHRYPTDIKWSSATKERLESLLISRVQPWKEQIKVKRIESDENRQDGIFVVEIPKSNNPPHMCGYRYYQRLNYQTQPMTHQNVFRAFQTSWIRKRDLHTTVLEPLYSELKMNCEKIENYEVGRDAQYQEIVGGNRYLYDLVEPSIQKKIDEFYRRMNRLNPILGGQAWRLATRIINEELCKRSIFRDFVEEHMNMENLKVYASLRKASGNIKVERAFINGALLRKESIEKYLQSKYPLYEVVDFEPVVSTLKKSRNKISESDFKDLWESCKSRVGKNKAFLLVWAEIPIVLALGKEVLEFVLSS